MNRNHIACGLYLLLAGCGRDLTPSDIKTVGVGLTPDEIGPEAEPYGGLVELDWVDFAGGQLPVALAWMRLRARRTRSLRAPSRASSRSSSAS